MTKLRSKNHISVSIIALAVGLFSATHSVAAVDETNKYRLRLMTQIFDGAKEFSHTQEAGVIRMRKGDESYTLIDFHDGAVVIEESGATSVGAFENTSGAEAEFTYDYATNTLSGHNAVAPYFNTYVRPQLAGNPALGEDAQWRKKLTLAEVGATVSPESDLSLDLERKYFSHKGVDYALIRYAVPAFTYSSEEGVPVVHWGQGLALTDPGFGVVYWSASLHRAVAQTPGDDAARPYRYAKTIAAVDDRGQPVIDPRTIDEVAGYFEDFYAPSKTGVLPFVNEGGKADQTPIVLAANLDQMALSIAENSPNQTGNVSGQNTNGSNGYEVAKDTTETLFNVVQKGVAVGKAVEKNANATNAVLSAQQNAPTVTILVSKLEDLAVQSSRLEQSYKSIINENARLRSAVEFAMKNVPDGDFIPESTYKLVDRLRTNTTELRSISNQIANLGAETSLLGKTLNSLPVKQTTEVMKNFGQSVGGKTLTKFSHAMNVGITGTAGINVYRANVTDLSSGDLELTRSYGTSGAALNLGLDLIGLAASAYADPKLAVTSSAALLSGSVGDLYISSKAKLDMDQKELELAEEGVRLRTKLGEMQSQQRDQAFWDESEATQQELTELAGMLDGVQNPEPWTIYHPNWDPKTDSWKQGTPQWEKEQAELAKLRNKSTQPTQADWDRFNRTIANLRDPYPKGPLYVPKETPTPEQQFSAIPDWLKEQWENLPQEIAKAQLDLYQEAKLKAQKEAYEERQAERNQRILDMRDGPVTFDPVVFEPVVFEPPEWKPPVWKPPVWKPPEFDAPIQSIIDFTQFDGSVDDNWLGFASVMAYQYGDMSGKVATDLGPYEDFIALHGLRKLERLALQAGYPNLASALNDWENLVSKANDQGFRQWAQRAPVCYMACVNIQGLWTQKKSQLALGDLLLDSRDLFSTAGLSDVTIGSLLLSIFIRDFALEDGDAIRVIVNQFGREIFNSSFVLTNAGQEINVALRPGVAGVEITALNTGDFPPNTAAVSISGVTNGDNDQSYSLDEGEQGVLRVNTGSQ